MQTDDTFQAKSDEEVWDMIRAVADDAQREPACFYDSGTTIAAAYSDLREAAERRLEPRHAERVAWDAVYKACRAGGLEEKVAMALADGYTCHFTDQTIRRTQTFTAVMKEMAANG